MVEHQLPKGLMVAGRGALQDVVGCFVHMPGLTLCPTIWLARSLSVIEALYPKKRLFTAINYLV
ncbi:MAG: hypothetical protein Tsb002_18920 [Wenzhouxiangellaceae bacterium]